MVCGHSNVRIWHTVFSILIYIFDELLQFIKG